MRAAFKSLKALKLPGPNVSVPGQTNMAWALVSLSSTVAERIRPANTVPNDDLFYFDLLTRSASETVPPVNRSK